MPHDLHDRVSFEIARRIAAGLPKHPEWIELARENLERWSERNAGSPGLLRNYNEWIVLLERSVPEICALLVARTDEGQRLRQNSPFVGALPQEEIIAIKSDLRHEAKRA